MFKGGDALVWFYAKKHCPNDLPKDLKPSRKEIEAVAKKIFLDFTKGATKTGFLLRLAGQSGSGKTTQLIPAAEAYAEKNKKKPILVAARKLAEYHPHYDEIKAKYGEARLREQTDDFATIMMYKIMKKLTRERYDLILDVSFTGAKMEAILYLMTKKYVKKLILMMAVSGRNAKKLLEGRQWRHSKELENEFTNSTEKALQFYGRKSPEMRIIIWGFGELEPAYDGAMDQAYTAWKKIIHKQEFDLTNSVEKLTEAKIKYLVQ